LDKSLACLTFEYAVYNSVTQMVVTNRVSFSLRNSGLIKSENAHKTFKLQLYNGFMDYVRAAFEILYLLFLFQ